MAAPPARLPPLHAAIWEGDVDRVRSILKESEGHDAHDQREMARKPQMSPHTRALLQQKDSQGHTPLHLAVRVVQPSQRAIVHALLEHGASVSSRSLDGWSCVHDATLCDDEFLLAQLFLHGERQLWGEVEEYQADFLQALERLPDFDVEIFVEAYSWIPGVSKMLPSQTNRIRKRGAQLRVDSTMKGLERFQLNHGSISHIFTGRTADPTTSGRAFIVNHDAKLFYDISHAVSGVSSAAKIDLGIHVLMTKEVSATSIDSAKLAFTKLKDVKEIKSKKRGGAGSRTCLWTGTKYEMKHFAASFAFRNPVNPKRQHRQFAGDGIGATEAALGMIDTYVSELHVNSNKDRSGKGRSMMDTSIHDDDDAKDTAPSTGADQELWVPKGKHMEMHLDVLAGDSIAWKYSCNSKEFAFVATSYEEDAAQPVSRCEGAKNATITGSYIAECNGSLVLRWQNTQKGFTLDKKGIKIVYNVSHTRPANVAFAPPVGLTADANTSKEETPLPRTKTVAERDFQVCHQFLRNDHIPNPMTVTMSLSEYLAPPRDPHAYTTTKSSGSMFKRSAKAHAPHSEGTTPPHEAAGPILASDGTECRNTFRSLTLLPTPRRFHKNFEGKVFMAHDFPIQMQDFVPVIEFLSKTGDQVKNLAEFFRMKLPPGFPVRFELPMLFTVRTAYTFRKAVIRDDLDPALFSLPAGYSRVTSIKDILPQHH